MEVVTIAAEMNSTSFFISSVTSLMTMHMTNIIMIEISLCHQVLVKITFKGRPNSENYKIHSK